MDAVVKKAAMRLAARLEHHPEEMNWCAAAFESVLHEDPHRARHAIESWMRMAHGHGPSTNDPSDIHWPKYSDDYRAFSVALGVDPYGIFLP